MRGALSPSAVARTARAVRRRGYDVVHVHEPLLPAACLAAIAAARVPLVATFHMYRRALAWYAVFAPVARLAAQRLDACLAVSPGAAEYARRGPAARSRSFRTGSTTRFSRRRPRSAARTLEIYERVATGGPSPRSRTDV